MIIKYRVHEVAKDFNVPSKEVIEIIMAATGAEKKHMTALNEDELNVVFEHFSRNKQVESFNEYLAGKLDIKTANDKRKREKEEIASEEAKPTEKEVKTAVKPSAKKDSDNGKGSAEKTRKETSKTLQKIATPITKSSSLHPAKKASSNNGGGGTNLKNKPAGRVIDTRAAQVDIEKYNEKYDRLASEKMKIDNTVRKQKITQKSQQRGKPRNSRKETEAERLRRIALERKNRPITVLIPENITVGELASRLKATAAEVIKKLMIMGIMASINDVVDFDTASLVAMEFHAKAAEVSIIVAINKMDKPGANPENIKQQLTEHGVIPEEWGGDTPCIPISAKKREGIDDLLEMIMLIADMKELKANPDRSAKGTIIEARLDKGRGPIATVLVQNGTLCVGDMIVAGTAVGKVRAMLNERGERVKSAGPSVPVEITGLDSVPVGGDTFNAVSDERLARELVEERKIKQKEAQFSAQTKVTLDNLFAQMKMGEIKELKVIVKADVQGSVEAVTQSLEKLSNNEVRVHVIHGAVGAVSESDVMLANASNAIIVGFNVRPDPVAAENAERNGVDLRLYRIIYDCIDEISAAMRGLLAPKYKEVQLGRAECRQVYKISNVGTIAGCYVVDGKISRNAEIRVVRDGIVVAEDNLLSLRRFKDDVKEVAQGYECGIGLEKFNDIKEGDVFEAFVMEEYRD